MGFIGKIVGAIVGVVMGIAGIFGLDGILGDLLAPIMKMFGFDDEEIVIANVVSTLLFDEDTYSKLLVEKHLEFVQGNKTSIAYTNSFMETGEYQFGKYFRKGLWDFEDALPTGEVQAISLEKYRFQDHLSALEGEEINIVELYSRTPYTEQWVKWHLQETYGFNYGTNSLKQGSLTYYYDSESLTPSGYDVTLKPNTVRRVRYRRVQVTVEPLTTDIEDTVTTTTTTYDNFYGFATNEFLYTEEVSVDVAEEFVPTGTVEPSDNIYLVETEDITPPTLILSTPLLHELMYFVCIYVIPSIGKKKIWIRRQAYDDPIFPPATSSGHSFQVFPIVLLRNERYNITEYEKSGRPATITRERYEQSHEMLRTIGLNPDDLLDQLSQNSDFGSVDHAFFLLAISPSNQAPIVSKALYMMVERVYAEKPPAQPSDVAYSYSVSENPYNVAILWKASVPQLEFNVIGGVGDCAHQIIGKNIYLRKQISPNVVSLYVMTEVTHVSVIRAGGKAHAVNLDISSPHALIPLIWDFNYSLTIMERTALLGTCCYLTMYSLQVQHLEWYETEEFRKLAKIGGFLIIIAVIVVGYFFSPALAAINSFLPASMALTMKGLLIALAVQLTIMFVMEMVDSPALAALLSLGAMVAGAYAGGMFDTGWLTDLGSLSGLASMCLQAGDIYMGEVLEQGMLSLNKDIEKFSEVYQQNVDRFASIMSGFDSAIDSMTVAGLSVANDWFSSTGKNSSKKSIQTSMLPTPDMFFYAAKDEAIRNPSLAYEAAITEMNAFRIDRITSYV